MTAPAKAEGDNSSDPEPTNLARLQAMGVDIAQGVLRVSFTHYTSQQEIDQLLNALDRVL